MQLVCYKSRYVPKPGHPDIGLSLIHIYIYSEKTAIVDSQPGDRPSTFIVNDTVTYADGHSENIYNSFTNESNANQVEWNDMSSSLPDTYDAPNPEDNLRDLMGAEEYADLMEETDAALFNLTADYAPSDFSGDPYAISENETDIACLLYTSRCV